MTRRPVELDRTALAIRLYTATVGTTADEWLSLAEADREAYRALADRLAADTLVFARMSPPAEAPSAVEMLAASSAMAKAQGADHARAVIRSSRELGVTTHSGNRVELDRTALEQMLAHAYVSGHRAAAAATEGMLDDLGRVTGERDAARAEVDRVRELVDQARARAAELSDRVALVELPDQVPTFETLPDSYSATLLAEPVGDTIRLYDLADRVRVAEISIDDAREVVPHILAIIRDRDRLAAEERAALVDRVARRTHARVCGDTGGACQPCRAAAEAAVEAAVEAAGGGA